MKLQSLIALSFGCLTMVAAASCANNGGPTDSGVNAADATTAAFPVNIVATENDASKYFLYVPSPGGETGFNYCIDNALADCQRGVGTRAMKTFVDPSNRRYYVAGPVALVENMQVNLISFNGTTLGKSRGFRLATGGANVALEMPKERQVFQREAADRGKIIVQFRSDAVAGAKYVKAKVSGTAKSNNVVAPATFKEYEVTAVGSSLRAAVDAPAGGWFTLDVVFLDAAKKPLGQAQVKEVGVGEVFLVAGQSNSTNCGRARQTTDNDFVMSTDGSAWRKGDDPQLGTHDDHLCNENNGYGGSNWPNTGNALVKKYKVPVAFASTGYSGSAIREWVPSAAAPANDNKGASLFEYTAKRAEQLSVGGFRAVLWHQGENDAKDDTTKVDYETKLGEVINGIRGRTKVTNPWLIAVASYCKPDAYPPGPDGTRWKGPSAEITGAQQEIVSAKTIGELYAGPSTDDLDQTYRGTAASPDDCHFNDQGLKEVGKRWADKVTAFVDAKIGTASDTSVSDTANDTLNETLPTESTETAE
jgi:hypothetical protein